MITVVSENFASWLCQDIGEVILLLKFYQNIIQTMKKTSFEILVLTNNPL
jgi:hypothetical protein